MPEKIRRDIFAAFFLVLIPIAVSADFKSDIQLISSDDDELSFRFNVDINNLEQYLTAAIDDSIYSAVKTILIGVPSGAEPFISDASAESIIQYHYNNNRTLISSNQLAEIAGVRTVRGRRIATVNIYPFYNGNFRKYIEVSIRFEKKGRGINSITMVSDDKIFESIYKNSIINYDQFKSWPMEARMAADKIAQSPFDIASKWYKIKTLGEGLIKISGQNLSIAGISISQLKSDSIHVYYGGGEPVPDRNSDPVDPFEEISILVEDGNDGVFGRDDYLLFFAEGADRWRCPPDSSPVYLENHYTNTNYYWLAVSGDFVSGGKRINSVSGGVYNPADTTIATGRFNKSISQNNMLAVDNNERIRNYFDWYWTSSAHITFYESFPNAITGKPADITVRAMSNPNNYMYVNSSVANSAGANRPLYFFETDRLKPGLNGFSLILDSSINVPTYFDYCQISYIGDLTPSNDLLDFSIGGFNGTGNIYLSNQFSTNPLIFDLSDPNNPVRITGAVSANNEISFGYSLSSTGPNRFYTSPISKATAPDEIVEVSLNDLRENAVQTDMIVIAPDQFLPVLEDYESYREEKSGLNVLTVSFDDIINQFSFGLYDPRAIRQFLKYCFENYPSPAPAAVLLVGDGIYDFENNLGFSSGNLIPPCIQAIDSSASDDNYVFFGEFGLLDSDTSFAENRGYDMMIARWPVKTEAELMTVIDKVKTYEASTNYGPWRTSITLVADDEFGQYDTEWFHTSQTEELQQPPRLPASFRRNKIYIWDYPFNSLQKKPLANEAIVRSFNEGTLLMNYVGHGNPDSWAHETVFDRGTDLIHLTNIDKLALVVTASCSIGFFDDPGREGMAEDLLRLAGGGAIGIISATRLVYSSDNAAFNKVIFEKLFENNGLTIGQAFYSAKLERQYIGVSPAPISNDRNYTYFGDPFVKLGVPQYDIKFINKPDSMTALQSHQASGEVVEKTSGAHVDFNGTADVFVFDSNIEKKHKVVDENGDSVKTVSYGLSGPAIFKGNVDITDGFFDFTFIAPLDIGVGGKTAKISAYGISSNADALGLVDSIPVSLNIISLADNEGPVINYSFGDRTEFLSGDKVTSGEAMTLNISDPSGINQTGSLGHEITLVIDDRVENTVNLTDLFQYSSGSYNSGTIEYNIGPLSAGLHSFRVKAWDNANNSSMVEFEADILGAEQFMLTDLMNYPNPMRGSTAFSFSLSSPASRVNLAIFTLSGKKIKNVEMTSVPSGYSEFYRWDGRDADADRIASGVYIYKVTAESEWFEKTVESFGKVVLIN